MKISLLENKRIQAEFNDKTIYTDQSTSSDGLGEYLSPFDLFKTSLGCCMGYYISSFCRKNNIPSDGISMKIDFCEDGVIQDVNVTINVDDRFPEKYYKAIIKSAETCKVKKQMTLPPNFNFHIEKGK